MKNMNRRTDPFIIHQKKHTPPNYPAESELDPDQKNTKLHEPEDNPCNSLQADDVKKKKWNRLRGNRHLLEVVQSVQFSDGIIQLKEAA